MSYDIQILNIPSVVPPVSEIEYQIDSGTIVPISALVDDYPVGFLPPGTYATRIRGKNGVGVGPWSDVKNKTIDWADILAYYGVTRGLIWDLDQIGTLWQNTTATVPVSAYGDPVGRVNDVSGFGNNLIQATSARRPTYARRPKSGIRNLLQRTEEFDNAYWVKVNTTVESNTTETLDPLGGNTATKLTVGNSGTRRVRATLSNRIAGEIFTFSFYAKSGTSPAITYLISNSSETVVSSGALDTATGVISGLTTNYVTSRTAASVGDGWYLVVVNCVIPTGQTTISVNVGYPSTNTTSYVWRPQLELGTSATPYQRVTNQFDVTEAGQPSINYLFFDGIDDCLQSATAIDFSNSDEMTVCLGQRKLSDASQRVLLELTADATANNGGLLLTSPNGASATYAIASRGTALATAEATGIASPDVCVLTAQSNISDDVLTLRRNAVQVATSSTDQGTGNYANSTLNIGARNNASLRFSGHLNSGFVFNKILNPTVLADMEKWVGAKAGIDL